MLFTVQDSGIGIPMEHREAVFKPFVQVDHELSRRFGGGAGWGWRWSSTWQGKWAGMSPWTASREKARRFTCRSACRRLAAAEGEPVRAFLFSA
ncbi:ATP-binding protein [Desulfonatronum thioautotrophicum]|uniref:ATP-binding protein n=1 Tax=Desulfonatronum thioautotrophicum TaxID=617001 RepID=UPI0005EB4204|nr:ATP-binding protein [Desulfonatronum thioautotrophicum]